jgi:hypothetical protein
MYIDKSRQRVANDSTIAFGRVFCKEGGVLQKCFFRSRVETDWRAAGAGARTGRNGRPRQRSAPEEDKMEEMWRMANPSDNPSDDDDWEGGVDPEKDWEPPDWLR